MVNKEKFQQQFICKAQKLYGDRFDYSKLNYVDQDTEVCIICPEHGDFWVLPYRFLHGAYCKECKKKDRATTTIKFADLNRESAYSTENFIAKLKEIFGDKYDYSETIYGGYYDKVCVVCPKHGKFFRHPSEFLQGKGCPVCNAEEKGRQIIYSKEDFIKKANDYYDGKYDYSNVNYTNSQTKVCIICPEHGEFWQTPYNHLKGKECPDCNKKKISNTEAFIIKANKIHNGKYDYSKAKYVNSQTKVCIICPEHGEFWQIPYSHISGNGCPMCSGLKKWDTEKFIKEARKIHGDKYDYSKTQYINKRTKVLITCPTHGDFWQTAHNHIQGQGCPKCGLEKIKTAQKKSNEQFIRDVKDMFGDKYTILEEYDGNKKKIEIFCNTIGRNGKPHGSFWIKPNDLLGGHGCPKCKHLISQGEDEVVSFIKSNYDDIIKINDRTVLKGKEIDIFLPKLSIGIEYNGLKWHSEEYKDKNDCINKLNTAKENNVQLFTIFEDEWSEKKDICKSRILNFLHKSDHIYARKCKLKEVSNSEAVAFLEKNHLQGAVNGFKNIGLFYNEELVSLMTFGYLRKNLGQEHQKNCYEMLRFCNVLNTTVIGGASKLLKYFIKTYHPKRIISYADRRWSDGNLYEKLGFKFCYNTKPNYFYIKSTGGKRINRFSLRKDVLVRKYNCPIEKTEHEFCNELGYYRVYDCGSKKYSLDLTI